MRSGQRSDISDKAPSAGGEIRHRRRDVQGLLFLASPRRAQRAGGRGIGARGYLLDGPDGLVLLVAITRAANPALTHVP